MRIIAVVIFIALVTFGSSSTAVKAKSSDDGRLTCTAFAASTGGPRTRPVAAVVDISVERWSTVAERNRLIEALRQNQETLLDALQDLPRVGYIRTPSTLGWDLHYANVKPADEGGRHVVIATDRPISIWEAVNRPRTIDYPFTFIELRLNRDGQGEGKLSLATRVIPASDGHSVELENYAAQPVQLNDVKCQ